MFIYKEAYNLLKNMAFPDKSISLSYESVKELPLSHTPWAAVNAEKDQSFIKWCEKMIRRLKLQKQSAKCNSRDEFETQFHGQLITGSNIQNLERKFIHKPKSSFQEIKTTCITYDVDNELDF